MPRYDDAHAVSYLGPFTYVADLPIRRGLRSSCSNCLVQPPVHRSTVGSRAFSVAGPQVWNCLSPEVTSAPSQATFRTRLKTFLFTESYPHIASSDIFVSTHSDPSGVLNTQATLKIHDWLICISLYLCFYTSFCYFSFWLKFNKRMWWWCWYWWCHKK